MPTLPSPLKRREAVSRLLLALATVAAIACATSTGVTVGVPASKLHFLTANASAPQIAELSVSFYGVNGQARSGTIYYHHDDDDESEGEDSTPLVRLDLPAGALTTNPDGSPLAVGDSVLVTLSVLDTAHLQVDVEPAGLQFSSSTPAQLTMSYLEADSSVSEQDTAALAIWQQSTPGGTWVPLPSNVIPSKKQVTAHVQRRSVYATAY
jgi:hypothetical protein